MPLRRTKRSNGLIRSRWKDGSHEQVESTTHASESRYDEIALEPNQQTEPLVTAPLLLQRSREPEVSARDCPAKAGADARIEESAANGEIRLALRPDGSSDSRHFLPDQLYSRGGVRAGGGRPAGGGGGNGRIFAKTPTAAVGDRLLHNAHRIELCGPSRRKESKKQH